jgi:hypothetical protein
MPKAPAIEDSKPPALSIADEIQALTDPSFMTSLARGLAVLRAFSEDQPQDRHSARGRAALPAYIATARLRRFGGE